VDVDLRRSFFFERERPGIGWVFFVSGYDAEESGDIFDADWAENARKLLGSFNAHG
jgi:hypothetical protein